jgi:cobalamin biosynthesis Mg chelatase CobN
VSPPTRVVPQHARAKPKATQRKTKAALKRKHRTPAAIAPTGQTLGASVGFLIQQNAKSGSSHDASSLFVILGLALALACLLIAWFPAAALPWRPVATFVSDRQLDLTLAGLALLAAALWVYSMKGL